MARDMFGNKKITKEDRYTKNNVSFSTSDELFEYFKLIILCMGALGYLYYIFK